jgi:tetratricopeptide (TPR) repeat protein
LWLGAFAAALFAWHPLRVESVVWVTERKDVMSGCFFLLTLLAYARYVDCRTAGRPWWRAYLLTVACFVAGLMSKPMLVTLPLVLLILDFWPFARCPSPAGLRLPLLEKVPFFALAGAATVATVLMQRHTGAFVLDLPLDARAGNAVVSVARYLGKFLWPFDLIVCYPHPGYWPALAVLTAAALALGLSWLAWRERLRRPWIAAGWIWFLVTLLPVIGLVQVGFQALADRYTYLSLLGIEVAALWSLGPAFRTAAARTGAAVAAAIVLAACAARTWDQQGVWRDSVSLFEHAVRVSDHNDVAEDFLASALFAADRLDEAAAHAERARALNPRNDTALITLAGVRERQGRLAEAAEFLRSALALRPGRPEVQCQLGLLELRRGRTDEARRLMTPALRVSPAVRERTLEIAGTAQQAGDLQTALFLDELFLEVAPDDLEALSGAAAIHAQRRDFAAAVRLCRRAVDLAPNDSRAHASLGYALILEGDRAAGLAEWRRALELDPSFPGLREQLMKASQPP